MTRASARVAVHALSRRAAEAATVRAAAADLHDGQGQHRRLMVCGDLKDVPEAATTQILSGLSAEQDPERGWRTTGGSLLADLPPKQRLTALAVYELAKDRAMGQPLETAATTLRAAASAEGLDASHDRIPAAAARISAEKGP